MELDAREGPTHGGLPLHIGIAHGAREEVVRLLLQSGPSLAAKTYDANGRLPLHVAAENQAAQGTVAALASDPSVPAA